MKTTISVEGIMAFGGLMLGALGCGYALGSKNKLDQTAKKLDISVDQLMQNGSYQIPDSMVEAAVQKSVERIAKEKIGSAVSQEALAIRKKAFSDIHDSVKEEVSSIKESLAEDVKKEINRALGEIDISKAKDEVIRAAAARAASKFDTDLEKVVDAHAAELQNVTKIYNAIANRITPNDDGRTIRLRLD